MTEKTRYWKSLQLHKGKIVSGYDKSPWTVGEWREVPAPIKECEGLNCCENIIDAIGYVNMEILAEVEIGGKQIVGDDKITVQRMRIIKAWQWEKKDSVEMAVYSAGLCLEHFEKVFPDDKRPRQAIESAVRWIADPTEENKSAARSAESAAESAARSAAWSVESAWSAARSAESAVESAARSARSAESAAESAESAARIKMKKKIHNWIVKHTKKLEAL